MKNPDEILEDLRAESVSPEELASAEAARLIHELRRKLRNRQQAEEALHTQALVLECMAEGVMVTDQQGNIIFTNPAFDAMFGYERGELAGRPSSFLNAYLPAENLRIVKEILRALAASGAWFGEFHNQKKDGSRFVTSARISVLKMNGKKFFISVQEDVTRRKETQAALEESEARYRTLVDLSPDAILVHAKGRYIFANAAALKLFGAAGPQEIIGQRVLDLVHPDSKETVRRRVEAGERLDLREVRVLRLDGQPVEVEVAAAPITYYGKAAIQVVLRDISRRRKAEQEIRRLASFPEGNPNPVLEMDEKGEVVYANPAARRLAEQLELTSGVTAFLPPNLQEIFIAVRNGGPSQYSYDLTIKDHVYAVYLSFPLDLPTARLYALDITERKQGEEALRGSESRFRQVVESLPQLVWTCRADGHCDFLSKQWLDYTGVAEGEQLGYGWLNQIHSDDRAGMLQRWEAAVATGAEFNVEFRIRRYDGVYRWFDTRALPLRDQDGVIVKWFGSNTDIQAQRELREALRESREDLNRAQAVAHTGSWRLNVQENALTWSDETHRIFGIPPGTSMTYETFLGAVHPDDREYVDQNWRAALKGRPYDIEHRIIADGTMKWVRERAELEFDSQGQILGGFGTVQDISKRKRDEEALRQAHDELEERVAERTEDLRLANEQLLWEIEERLQVEERLRDSETRFAAFMEHLPGFAVMRDIEGRYLFANQAWEEAIGFPPWAWRHKTLDEVWPPKQAAALKEFDFQVISSGKPMEQLEKLVLADGNDHYFLTHRFPIRDKEGLPFMVGVIAIDVTARHQAEEALAEHAALVQDLYNNAPCGYHSLDPAGVIVQINDTELAWLGYSREEVVNRLKFSDLLTPESIVMFQESFPRFKAQGMIKDMEYEMVRKDGTLLPVLLSATAITDAAGNFVMSRSTIFDITDRKRAEKALAAERQRFFDLLENLPAFVYLQAPDYNIQFANRQFRERFGEHYGCTCFTLMRGQGGPCQDCPTFTVFRTGKPKEWEFAAPDGRIYQVYDYPFADTDGSPLVLEMGIDITARKRAEEVIREQSRQLEAFFAHSLTPVVFLDPNFTYLRVNEAYARACQRQPQDFIGRNHFDFYHHAENQAIFAEVVRSKAPFQVQAKPFEFPDHPEWGVTYWDWSLTPILDQAGEVDFLVFSLRDVTKRVKAEQARGRLIEILEATPDFVGIGDYYGNLLYLNRAGRAMVGVGEEEDISSLKVLQFHPGWAGRLILEKGSPTAMREGVWQAEIALLHRDGREIPVSQVILAHKGATGRVDFFSTIARDIGDMKQAQESILRQTAILNGINRIFREALASETKEDLGRTCLSIVRLLTDSQFGFIHELNEQGLFDGLAFSDPSRELNTCSYVEAQAHLKNVKPLGLLAKTISSQGAVVANEPAPHPQETGIPEEYPPLSSFLGMPLLSGGKPLGLLGLGNKAGGYTGEDQEAVESLAPAIVEALMHRRAQEALRVSERRLRRLADQLLTAQENERKRLAAELHDELGHALLALKLALSAIEKKLAPEQENLKQEIRDQLNYIHEVIQDVRRLYHDLSPGDVEDLGLTKALSTLIRDFAGYQPSITWKVDLADLEGLFSLPVQTTIYRIVQEALTNIGKHAIPSTVAITAVKTNQQVLFTIEDDGKGFDVAQVFGARGSHRGVGLVAIEERVHMVGGSFNIQSREQEGTRLSFTIPTIPEGEIS